MTPQTAHRHFVILSFTYRDGKVYQRDKDEFTLPVSDNCTGYVLNKVRLQAFEGFQVLVFESGAIKTDWCRLNTKAFHLLATLDEFCFARLFSTIRTITFRSCGEFQAHVVRSFPILMASDSQRRFIKV